MNLTVGLLLALGCIFGGYVGVSLHSSGWNTDDALNALYHLWQPWEFVIIIGASFGAMVASNKGRVLKKIAVALKKMFTSNAVSLHTNEDLLCLMFELVQKISRGGMRSVEEDIESPKASAMFMKYPSVLANERLTSFISEYARMMLGGSMNLAQFESLMQQEIEVLEEELMVPADAVHTVADGLPAFGIVAAIMGVVIALQSINQPDIGEKIAAAMVGTFLGVLLSYSVVSPIAKVLEHDAEVELRPYYAVKAILLAYLNKFPPFAAVEFGRKVLFSDQRPSYEDLEKATREIMRSANR
jgi:chemotaxis protein MotA